MKKIIFIFTLFFIITTSVKAADLTIINIQEDNTENTYTYKLNIYNATGAYQYNYENKESYIVFDAAGSTTFTLKNNEKITIKNLPDSSYKIEQEENNNYETYINDKKTFLFYGNTKENNEINFHNKNKNITNPNTTDRKTNILIISCILIIFILILKTKKIKKYY